MTTPNFVYAGAKAPEALRIDISPSSALPDLSVVTAASCSITRPNRTTTTWAPTLSNQSSTTLRLTWVFASDGNDVADVGGYAIVVYLTTPGGVRRCAPIKLRVLALTP